jgi:hypothetical protein
MGEAPLSREQTDFFRREGFLRLRRFVAPAAILALRPVYDRLFQARTGFNQGDYFDLVGPESDGPFGAPQLLRLSAYAPELLGSPVFPAAWAVARQILGPAARLDLDHGILKPARSAAPTPWHQDEAFWDGRYEHDGISIWIPLQDVDEDSGCLQFAPASHRRRVLPHRTIGDDPRVHGLEVPGYAPLFSEACPLPLGGATVHHARTLHYSAPNASEEDRRAYVLVFSGRKRRRFFARPQHRDLARLSARLERARTAEKTSGPS